MNKSEKLKRCYGCEQDFYNDKNPLGIKECWSLADMTIIWRKKVSVDQRPPWTQAFKRYPHCYQQTRYFFINKGEKE